VESPRVVRKLYRISVAGNLPSFSEFEEFEDSVSEVGFEEVGDSLDEVLFGDSDTEAGEGRVLGENDTSPTT